MRSLTYFAVLEPSENGGYGIFFPDLPGCYSYAESLEEASAMAEEAASLHVYGLEEDGDPVPSASTVVPKLDIEDMIVLAVKIHPDIYRIKHENRRVKTNTTIPMWLKKVAEERNVNYSQLLEAALMDYLEIKTPAVV
ncbi:MAG: type II toxin-antitoxin system HicB family antitoxin [Lachnospiraceae bacterium]|nr:type II toxin-antitoxin system HicB family antitoxin [Lachnospiraceae bacterium]